MLDNFRAFQLAKTLYQISKTLRLSVHLKDQLLRSTSSIALNLAESSGERSEKEKDRYYTMARGSFFEAQAILELEGIHDPDLADTINQLGAVLYALCRVQEKRGICSPKTCVTKTEN